VPVECLFEVTDQVIMNNKLIQSYVESPYFHVAHAHDLVGADRVLYRLLESIPALISWSTIFIIIFLSVKHPTTAAYLIIAFDLYWLLKTFYLSMHQRYNWKRLKHNIKADWKEKIAHLKYEHIWQFVILPYYKEPEEIVEAAIQSIKQADYNPKKIILALAAEERAGKDAVDIAVRMKEKYAGYFGYIVVTAHPEGLQGEIKGKGPNITYAAEQVKKEVIDVEKIPYEDIIVSAFDIDTVILPQYFLCLTWYFLTTENPHKASFQPVPLYNNNIWEASAISRVAAFSSTFWQMIQQERSEKLTTFSSHAISFKALHEIGFWQKNMISDDSRIFWNLFLANNGDYQTVAISYPVSMDATTAEGTWNTLRNIYKQQFRWLWGVENVPYMLLGFIKNKAIPLRTRIYHTLVQLEGWWSLATHPFLILLLGWLPLVLGGDAFRDTVLSYNLPYITRNLMVVSMLGLVLAAFIAFSFMPKLPEEYPKRKRKYVGAVFQWLLVPFTIVIFGAVPGIHAQTRLALGKYLGEFWVTPKQRKKK
jgi:cellulose synthase/poly-beta-1,6-N-acetylglucosamine synthase-like glycosyltransferase